MSSKLFLKAVRNGRLGHNIGVSTGLEKLDSVIFGIQKKCLITIGADSGSGKTSFALASFIYNLIKNKGDNKLSILSYSFEISKEALYAKLTSLYIYDTFGVVLPFKKILSFTDIISDEELELIEKSTQFLEKLDEYLKVYDRALTPPAIYASCKEWLSSFGEFEQIDEHRENYTPNDDRYKVVIWDHVGLISNSGNKKEAIDKVADYAVYFRNKCGITGIFVQQLNRGAKSVDRKTKGFELIGLEDFKDTSGTTDASEIVLALYYPYREKIAKCEGYPIQNVLKKKFRLLEIIKNRYGDADLTIGCMFYGEVGLFKELPKSDDIIDYTPYLEFLETKKDDEKKDEEEEQTNKFYL